MRAILPLLVKGGFGSGILHLPNSDQTLRVQN